MMVVAGNRELDRHDVIIIGGGLVGASLACALAPLGLDVALVEAVALRAASQPSYDDRTLALSASSCKILEALGLWLQLADDATAIREIQVRELDRPGRVILRPDELGLDRFGNVVEARRFGAVMAATLPGLPNFTLHCPADVTGLDVRDDCGRVEFRAGGQPRSIEGRLIVGADGAQSFVRERLGIESERHDYRQTAVICNITPEQSHGGRAFECFTPTGPFAVMPHVNGRCGLIWCVEAGREAELLNAPEDEFLQLANRRFGSHLGKFLRMGRRTSYALRLVRAHEDSRGRAVLVGNAAHAIHPIGAQGFNLGLRDVAALAEVLAEARTSGADIGCAEVLRRYSAWRAEDQRGTVRWSDGLARAYANPTQFAAVARTAGLLAHAFVPSLRRQMAIRAMGYRGRVPRLALGEPL